MHGNAYKGFKNILVFNFQDQAIRNKIVYTDTYKHKRIYNTAPNWL